MSSLSKYAITKRILEMKNIKQAVEDLGVQFEKFGRTPMVSRVFSYLLIADPAHRSFDEIVAFLGASKSAISNALNFLQTEGLVTYITFSGDRKRYFRVDAKEWLKSLKTAAKSLTSLNSIITETMEYRAMYEDQKMTNELKDLLDFQTFLTERIELAIKDWNELKQK